MVNYLKMADRQRILALVDLGWSYRRIERETGVRRETVSRYVREREAKPAKAPTGSEAKPATVPTGSQSACEPYRAIIEAALSRGLTSQRIWQDLQEEYGFSHGYCSVKRYVGRLKRTRPEVAGVMEHPPGREAQVDFFRGPPTLDRESGKWRRPWVFKMVLSCSRHSYEEPMWRQDQTSFLRAHEHAFLAFCGVSQIVRLDNLKSGVARACLYDPDVSELYAAFARHWGFVPLPCRPRTPEEQGVVERGGGYLKSNFLKGRRFEGLEELDASLKRWNRTVARLRIHGTTRKQVYAHFLEVEKPALQAVPSERFSLFRVGTRTVHPDGHVQVDSAFYSVPHWLVGREVRVHWDERLIRIYHQGECVGVHSRAPVGTFATRDEDRPAHKPARQEAYEAQLLSRVAHIGPRALAWAEEAARERGVRAFRLLQGVIALTRSHPKERVDWACGIALKQRMFRYRPLRRLVEEAASRTPPPPPLTQSDELIRDLSEYAQEVKT